MTFTTLAKDNSRSDSEFLFTNSITVSVPVKNNHFSGTVFTTGGNVEVRSQNEIFRFATVDNGPAAKADATFFNDLNSAKPAKKVIARIDLSTF